MQILIIGAGVIGLTTGVRLVEAGHQVVIWRRDPLQATTSSVAGAVWEPYAVEPVERVFPWAATAYAEFKQLAADKDAGVRMAQVVQFVGDPKARPPDWLALVDDFRREADEYRFTAPVIEMPMYIDYLATRFAASGTGRIVEREAQSLPEVFAAWNECFEPRDDGAGTRVIVNCAGLGARELVGDQTIYGVRGQVVRIVDPAFNLALLAPDEENEPPTYIIPRINDTVLGGSFQERNECRAIDDVLHHDILMRCAKLALPVDERFAMSLAARVGGDFAEEFADQVSPEHRATPPAVWSSIYNGNHDGCGLRPLRGGVRLERVIFSPARMVIHNYGHGGAGVTLSWGCADEVLREGTAVTESPHSP